jgi:hypothetical protein
MEVLFRLLSDRPADPWAGRRKAGHATLFRFSVAYAEVLAALGPFHPPDADRDRACGDLAAAWLRATIWPKAQTAAAVEQHLHMYTEAAIISQRDGVGLHYWFGPEVPLRVLVSGPGNKSWDFEKT